MTRREHSPFFYVSSDSIDEDRITISGEQSRHLALVRRAQVGDIIHVSNGQGLVMDVLVESVASSSSSGTITKRTEVAKPLFEVTVLQGLAKGSKVDLVVQKLVEIGVDRICVFDAGRSVPHWDERKKAKALDRWNTVALEAARQSHRAWLPSISGPADRTEALHFIESCDTSLIAHGSGDASLKEVLERLAQETSLAIVVGPEGGLTDEEVEFFRQSGGKVVSLGSQVLRTETAALVVTSVVMFVAGRLSS